MSSEYTQAQLDRAGLFRGFPIAWTLQPAKEGSGSQSVAIAFQFGIYQEWFPDGEGAWSQPWPAGYFVLNYTYIVGTEGNENAAAIEALAKAGLWDGDFDKLMGPPPSVYVLLDVKANEFKGRTSFRAEWVNPDAERPTARGEFKPLNTDLLAQMRARFGTSAKAIAGGKPAGAAPAPPTQPALQPAAQTVPTQPAPQPATQQPATPPVSQPAVPQQPPPQTAPAAPPAPQAPAHAPAAAPSAAPGPQPAVAPPTTGIPPDGAPAAGFGDSAESGPGVPLDGSKPPF